MKDTKSDILKIVVEVPCGVRDLEEIKNKIIRVAGIETVVYDDKQWNPKKDAYEEYLDDFTFQMLMKM